MMQTSTKGAVYLVTEAWTTVSSISVGKHFKKSDFSVGSYRIRKLLKGTRDSYDGRDYLYWPALICSRHKD